MQYTHLHIAEEAASQKPVNPNIIHDGQEGVVVHITLQPGAHLKTHTTPVHVVFYVLSGSIQIDIGSESGVFSADTVVESPKDIPHALTNTSTEEPARILVMKMPKP
ncbi:MAG: cupin domain-containing protein [Spirochaetota bacterium]